MCTCVGYPHSMYCGIYKTHAPKGVYYGEALASLGIRSKSLYVATGEFRPPKAGEFYLSGAIINAYRVSCDLTTSYWIAIPFADRRKANRRQA